MIKQPNITPISDLEYELVEDYVYTWEHNFRDQRLTIPKGFIFDGASVPQILWWTGLRPDGLLRAGALLHDWIYSMGSKPGNNGSHHYYYDYHGNGKWVVQVKPWTRKQSDQIFSRAMREAEYPKWKRRIAYIAVRLFGRGAWSK